MIKRFFTMLALAVLGAAQLWAIPAAPWAMTKTQPDGTVLSVRLHGDEFYSYYTTQDGYTLVQDDKGYWNYAQAQDGELVPSGRVARDQQQRTAADEAFLATVGKGVLATAQVSQARTSHASRAQQMGAKASRFDYSKFRGLVVLVQWSDVSFTRSDVKDFYNKMINQDGYTGFTNEDGSTNRYGTFTGSMRDYFNQNSNGKFKPSFDVVGPVTVNYSIDYPNRNANVGTVIKAALNALNSQVDYSKYDTDGNGTVDMFYVIFAGVGSNTGEADKHVWPHASYVSNLTLDGVKFGRYACSCEYYSQSYGILDGIGTMCHEFTHVLGLMDLYDTDYESNGQSHEPGDWEIMSGGGYNNYGRTPAGYSAYDKYTLGFLNPTTIIQAGTYELNPLVTNHEALRINTPDAYEYILLENRQLTSWDAALPGHGMLAVRVDSTDTWPWLQNTVNAKPAHNYYVLLRAVDTSTGDADTDPFPGASGVPMIGNFTNPTLKTYDGRDNTLMITDITEDANGKITIKVAADVQRDVEGFEAMATTTTKGLTDVQGDLTKWNFPRSYVTAPGDGNAQGTNAVAMVNPSAVTMNADVRYDAYRASVRVVNGTTADGKFTLSQSTDGGSSWTVLSNVAGLQSVTVPGGADQVIYWPLSITSTQNVRYRVNMTAGSKTNAVYLDDFTIYYTSKGGALLRGDINQDGVVDVNDVTALINKILAGDTADTSVCDLSGDGVVNVTDVTTLVNLIVSGN